MKKIKNWIKIGVLIFGMLITFTNCEKNELITQDEKSETNLLKITRITTSEINNNSNLISELSKFKIDKNSTQSKIVPSENYDFKINTDYATYIESEDDSYHSYTFQVIKNDGEGGLQNLLVSLNSDGTYDLFLISYNLSVYELAEFIAGNFVDFNNKITKTPIEDEQLLNSLLSKKDNGCVTVIYEFCSEGNHPGGYVNGDECPAHSTDSETYCFGGGGTSGPSSGNPTSGTTSGGDAGEGGATGSNNNSNYIPFQPIYTVPYCPECPEIEDGTFPVFLYSLTKAQQDFLDLNPTIKKNLEIFLDDNNNSIESINFAKGQVELETKIWNTNNNNKWTPENGKIKGRDDLKYTKVYHSLTESHYLMEDGSYVIGSGTELTLNSDGQLAKKVNTELFPNESYWYVKHPDVGEWANFLFSENSLADEVEKLLIMGSADIAKSIGRYALPVEEFKVVFTGTDFDGNQVNQYLNAGILIVGFIPGSKALKVVPKISKGTKVWKLLLKGGNHSYTRIVKELSELQLQKLDDYTTGVKDLLDDAFRQNEYLDNVIEEVIEILPELSQKKGSKLTWTEVKALFKRGNDFNKKAEDIYEFNEVALATGKRLDTYIPNIAIISRKATTLSNIKQTTFKNYLKELITKYPKNSPINAPKFGNTFTGQVLKGDYFLEIPLSNKAFFENSTIFQSVLNNFNSTNNVVIKIKYLAE